MFKFNFELDDLEECSADDAQSFPFQDDEPPQLAQRQQSLSQFKEHSLADLVRPLSAPTP